MSQFPQPGYAAPAPAAPAIPPEFMPFAQQLQQGQFPYLNSVAIVGQVFPTQNMPSGFTYNNQNNRGGMLRINMKTRKSWGGQRPGMKIANVQVIAYGQLAQSLSQVLQPGMIIAVRGEYSANHYPSRKHPGEWDHSSQIVMENRQNQASPLTILGGLQCVQENNPPKAAPAGGYAQPAPQPGYAAPAGGYAAPAGGYAAPAPAPAPAPVQQPVYAPQPGYPAPVQAQPGYPAPAPAGQYLQPGAPQASAYPSPAPAPAPVGNYQQPAGNMPAPTNIPF
jgi:single-stranded DNA-binding protein